MMVEVIPVHSHHRRPGRAQSDLGMYFGHSDSSLRQRSEGISFVALLLHRSVDV
jgi:hypothetical protein